MAKSGCRWQNSPPAPAATLENSDIMPTTYRKGKKRRHINVCLLHIVHTTIYYMFSTFALYSSNSG
ncbi:MAG: hypothetical protein KBA11_05960, partial [Sedimentibacter sp.]|nr:hypothetical protein [Sedimentibacter sp.]